MTVVLERARAGEELPVIPLQTGERLIETETGESNSRGLSLAGKLHGVLDALGYAPGDQITDISLLHSKYYDNGVSVEATPLIKVEFTRTEAESNVRVYNLTRAGNESSGRQNDLCSIDQLAKFAMVANPTLAEELGANFVEELGESLGLSQL
jgi:hypothetical protein